MRIQHNVTALNAYRNLRGNNVALSKNLEKLSSGYRINRAGDDAAGLAVSEKMRAQIRGLETAEKNAQDGISLVQTAEGALTEVHGMLNRMVELATQSANGTYDNEVDRANLQKEVASLKGEIDRIAEASNYNGIKLLDGSLSSGGIKTTIPNVTVNGVSGDAADANVGAEKVIEVTRAEDYKFSAAIDIHDGKKVLDKAGFDEDKTGQIVRIQVKYNDEAGKEHIINMKLVSANHTSDAGKIDVAEGKSEVTLDGVKLKNDKAFSGITDKYSAKTANDKTIAHAAEDILKNVSEFSNLFSTMVTAADTDKTGVAPAASNTGKYLKVEAKETGTKAEVTSFLMNETIEPTTDEAEFTIKDTAFSQVAAKIEDKIIVNGDKLHAVATGKVQNGDLKEGIIEVDGQKFAFVNSKDKDAADVKEALANFGVREDHMIYTSDITATTGQEVAMNATDAKAMADLINTTLGKEVADSDGTKIIFKNKENPGNGKGLELQIGDTADKFNKMTVFVDSMSTKGLAISDVDVSSQDKASDSISKIKAAINSVSSTRGDLGALQNRLEHTISNLGVMTENITDAESRIRDTDMAKEMMAYTKNNILVQASQAMLAQANQIPQGVLQLLG